MREPKLGDLKIDAPGTRQIRQRMVGHKSIKITINIDQDSLAILRAKSANSGVPYQRLLNRILGEALRNENETNTRIERLEKEVDRLKRKLVA